MVFYIRYISKHEISRVCFEQKWKLSNNPTVNIAPCTKKSVPTGFIRHPNTTLYRPYAQPGARAKFKENKDVKLTKLNSHHTRSGLVIYRSQCFALDSTMSTRFPSVFPLLLPCTCVRADGQQQTEQSEQRAALINN